MCLKYKFIEDKVSFNLKNILADFVKFVLRVFLFLKMRDYSKKVTGRFVC